MPEYSAGTARALLGSSLVTEATRRALLPRLDTPAAQRPTCLASTELETLRVAADRLLPRTGATMDLDLAAEIDRRLGAGESDGWRYDVLPPDRELYQRGLAGLEETANLMFGRGLATLDPAGRDAVLGAVQRGDATGLTWRTLPPARFFEELLAELVETFYSHPLAYEEIGFVGFADARGWQAIGLDRLAPHEPRVLGEPGTPNG